MDVLKVNQLVREAQANWAKALDMKVSDVQARENISYKQLMTEIDHHSRATFGELYNELESWCKVVISRRTNRARDDVWHDFVEKKLPGVIIRFNFDNEYNCSFISWLRRSLTNFCILPPADPVLPIDDLKIPAPEPDPTVIRIMEFLNIFIPIVDNLRSGEERKLVYHCIRFLKECCNYDHYTILKYLRGKTLRTVTELIEDAYSRTFGTKTRYMEAINSRLEEKRKTDIIFLENINIDSPEGKQTLRDWVRDIDNSFRNNKEKIINSIN